MSGGIGVGQLRGTVLFLKVGQSGAWAAAG